MSETLSRPRISPHPFLQRVCSSLQGGLSRAQGGLSRARAKPFDQLVRQIQQAGGTLQFTSKRQFDRAKTILEQRGGKYGTLPTSDQRTMHQVTFLLEGKALLVAEYVTR